MNGAQQDVIAQLGSTVDARPHFPADLRHHLRTHLEEALGPIGNRLGGDGDTLTVSKHLLSQAHGCETRLLAEDGQPFVMSPPLARGTVAHKAIELSIHWPGDPLPLELVDEAMARLTESDKWLADWLQTCTDADRAELRAAANERVVAFTECWPPLRKKWVPVTEQTLAADLCDGRIRLKGKVDLTLGQTRGDGAGKVIVDFKTGAWTPAHYDDLRFYALVETLRLGTPPRRLASYYLDSATVRAEDVTVGLLEAAAARVIDGVERLVELRAGQREANTRPSWSCRWCIALADCVVGRTFLRDHGADP